MLGTGEILVILCVILILFGGKKLPEFAKHLGQGIREFKKACSGIDEDISVEKTQPSEISQAEPKNQEHNDRT